MDLQVRSAYITMLACGRHISSVCKYRRVHAIISCVISCDAVAEIAQNKSDFYVSACVANISRALNVTHTMMVRKKKTKQTNPFSCHIQ